MSKDQGEKEEMENSAKPIPSPLKRASIWSFLSFIYFFVATLSKDQSYIESVRFSKAAMIGAIASVLAFMVVSCFVYLRCFFIKRGNLLPAKSLKIIGFSCIIIFSALSILQVISASQADTFTPVDRWTEKRRTHVLVSCMGEFEQGKVDSLLTHAYCECLRDKIQEKWGYGEYLRTSEKASQTLKNENAPAICAAIAASRKNSFERTLELDSASHSLSRGSASP